VISSSEPVFSGQINGLYENALKAAAIAIYAPAGMRELNIELIAFTQ